LRAYDNQQHADEQLCARGKAHREISHGKFRAVGWRFGESIIFPKPKAWEYV